MEIYVILCYNPTVFFFVIVGIIYSWSSYHPTFICSNQINFVEDLSVLTWFYMAEVIKHNSHVKQTGHMHMRSTSFLLMMSWGHEVFTVKQPSVQTASTVADVAPADMFMVR